ncbi:MAG: hypothetical protein IPK99_14735 [Flavobacteriales bacterium]|nr:hypothetical protein [Flavobacteriales bacterium]
MRTHLLLITAMLALFACKKDDPSPLPVDPPADNGPRLILKFKFDSTQVRLDEFGQPEPNLPAGRAAQSPRFNRMSSHYVEFAPNAWTLPGTGEVVYHAPETTAGGPNAIDFSQSVQAPDGGVFLNVPLSTLEAGSYPWIRVSLAYQNYDIDLQYTDTLFGLGALALEGTIASFIGFNTYISTFTINEQSLTVNDDRAQGFWAFEVIDPLVPIAPISGQAAGVTTVPNPLFASSPIPSNSCLVTGGFAQPLVITGNETEDVVITVSLSTNNSFEWLDNGDGIYEPGYPAYDMVVDMGVRGLVPTVE